jgi:iron complex outermembrane receptor protein
MKRSLVNSASRTAVVAALAGAAAVGNQSRAAEADSAAAAGNDQVAEVVVSGFRESLQKALEIKLNADHIVDSIVAEDIGKLPDQNIAEAIERVPGVSVSYQTVNGNNASSGEPTEITVRGLKPEFNTALYNGRVLSTDSSGREFNFDILPAELIRRVDVSKTATAAQPEGGIAATINLITARPLDLKPLELVASAQANYDEQRGQASPQGSFLFSTHSDDKRWGVLVAGSYIKRQVEDKRIYSDGIGEGPQTVDTKTVPGGIQAFGPTYTEFEVNPTNRQRTSGTVTVQFAPVDSLLFTLDGLYSKLDVNDNTQAFFTGNSNQASGVTVGSDGTITSYTGGTGYAAIVNYRRPELAKTKEVGFNTRWDASSRLTMTLDLSWSRTTNDNGGHQSWFEADYPGASLANVSYALGPNHLPTFTGLPDFTNTAQLLSGFHTFEGQDFTDRIYAADYRLKFEVDSGVLKNFQGGVNYSDRFKDLLSVKTPDNIIALQQGLQLPSNLYSPVTGASNLFGTGMFATPFPGYNLSAVQAYLLSPTALTDPAAQALFKSNGGGFGVVPLPGASGAVTEKTGGAFVEANLADGPWSGNVGLRYTATEVESTGVFQDITGVTYTSIGYPQVSFSPPVANRRTGRYGEWLPNANFKYNFTDSLMLQLAVARTLTRPTLSDLLIEQTVNARQGVGGLNISEGNPALAPMLAWNYDAALTWHHNNTDFLSAGLFAKNISNLEYLGATNQTIVGETWTVNQPMNLLTEKLIGVELSGQYVFSDLPAPFDGLGLQGNYSYAHPSGGAAGKQSYTDMNSQTYNLIGFYEKGPVQFRVAYNWRNAYISQHNVNTLNGAPYSDNLIVAAYGEVDASVQYTINNHFIVFAQALNLNDEKVDRYWNIPDRISDYEGYGRRFGLGVRVKY